MSSGVVWRRAAWLYVILYEMKSTAKKLLDNGISIIGWSFAGAIAAWCSFYILDFTLQRISNIHLYHRGELLMDAFHKPTDSLVLSYLLFFWLLSLGFIAGLIFGVLRVLRRE